MKYTHHRTYYLLLATCFILIIYIVLTTLFACTPENLTRITLIPNVIWYSENPKIEILITQDAIGHGFGYIQNNTEKIDIYFSWRDGRFSFLSANSYGANYLINGNDIGIHGSYSSNNNDLEAVLQIDNDNMFEGKYTNTKIYLKYRKINPATIDAKYQINVCWNSYSPYLTFKIPFDARRKGEGKMEYGNLVHSIIFYWEEDSKFSIYEFQNNTQSQNPVITGVYTSNHLQATLVIETDLILNHTFNTIELTAEGSDYLP